MEKWVCYTDTGKSLVVILNNIAETDGNFRLQRGSQFSHKAEDGLKCTHLILFHE